MQPAKYVSLTTSDSVDYSVFIIINRSVNQSINQSIFKIDFLACDQKLIDSQFTTCKLVEIH